MARPERLELPTYWFEASRSIRLSYGRARLKDRSDCSTARSKGERVVVRHLFQIEPSLDGHPTDHGHELDFLIVNRQGQGIFCEAEHQESADYLGYSGPNLCFTFRRQ